MNCPAFQNAVALFKKKGQQLGRVICSPHGQIYNNKQHHKQYGNTVSAADQKPVYRKAPVLILLPYCDESVCQLLCF